MTSGIYKYLFYFFITVVYENWLTFGDILLIFGNAYYFMFHKR